MESDKGKLFVGGISRETTEATLNDHFSKYGTVLSSVVAKDRNTKIPRTSVQSSFASVEVKKAIPRSEQQQQQLHHYPNQQQNSGFSTNGSDAADIVVMHDSMTNRPRGFGFVTFDSEESVENVMQKNFHELNNRLVEVKRAVPKEGSNGRYSNQNMKPGAVRGSPYNGFQAVEFTSNGSGYGIVPGYAPLHAHNPVGDYLYGTGVYGSGYPMVGYGRIDYGVATPTPRGPLYAAPVMLGPRVYSLPYGSPSIYPAYMNAGVGLMGTAAGGFNGIIGNVIDGKWNQVPGGNGDLPANDIQPQIEAVNNGTDSSGLKENSGGASAEQDQKSVDGELKTSHVDVSR
ncbi:Growth-regulating factor 1 [Hibiscus syriacus]|uniref:Growth-regulating factor 1 n=1 Tax=Hibiscus syriacus TaxID=106335 RepID=A0A6A2ZEB0_HIBSY|nr:Growth-regulating factor 1 [Hibiscus syriacus]